MGYCYKCLGRCSHCIGDVPFTAADYRPVYVDHLKCQDDTPRHLRQNLYVRGR
ncbi:hypothetical protein B0H19DRAFT_1124140, partial [Mycena capillaripes]